MEEVEDISVAELMQKPRKTSRLERSLRARKQRQHVKEIKLAKQLKLDKESSERLKMI